MSNEKNGEETNDVNDISINKNNKKYLYENNQLKNIKNIFIEKIDMLTKPKILELIKMTLSTNSYEETITCFEKLYEKYPKSNYLSLEELVSFQKAFKENIYKRQKQIEILTDFEKMNLKNNFSSSSFTISQVLSGEDEQIIRQKGIELEKKYVVEEIKNFCLKVLDIINTYIKNNINNPETGNNREIETLVFIMKGDIYKYLSGICADNNLSKNYLNDSKENYLNGYYVGEKYLESTNKLFLDILLFNERNISSH